MDTYTEQQIVRIGGNLWEKGGKRRVYLDRDLWAQLAGLETSHYRTGNISSATLHGERISNSYAREILGSVHKVFWDSTDGRIHIERGFTWRRCGSTPDWIREGIAREVAANERRC